MKQVIIFTLICIVIGIKYDLATEWVFIAGYLTGAVLDIVDKYYS